MGLVERVPLIPNEALQRTPRIERDPAGPGIPGELGEEPIRPLLDRMAPSVFILNPDQPTFGTWWSQVTEADRLPPSIGLGITRRRAVLHERPLVILVAGLPV